MFYIFKRLDLKRFEIFKNIPSNCRPLFSDFFSKISAILLSTESHTKCIVCICVSFLCICLTSETLHYPWILSYSLALHLNVTPEQPWFIHNNKKYFLMFDPPHLIKCVRNNLMKYCFIFGQYVATWKDIEDLYEKDSALPIRSAPKLTEKHIHPTNFNKMRVKLATQVLSHTVAASLCMYASLGGLPSTVMGTGEFVLKFDSVFDCVNCSILHSTKKLKCPLNDISPNKEFMKEAINFIKGLKVFNGNEDVTSRIKCLKGWAVTLSAILAIWDHQCKS